MTLNQKYSKTGPVWAGDRAFSIAASRQDTDKLVYKPNVTNSGLALGPSVTAD